MKILPVLDVQYGLVVHGVGGRREEYRPVESRWTDSARPLDVAQALQRHFGFTDFYVADLDAIAGAEPASWTYLTLQAAHFRLWVDAGVVDTVRACALAHRGIARIIAGLETLAGPRVLADIYEELGTQVTFSLDLRLGQPLGTGRGWRETPWDVVQQAIQCGARSVLLLDLARVGMRSGTGTEELAARLSATYPHVEIIAGGGIRSGKDLRRLEECGVGTALMATALHDGSITPDDLGTW